MSSSFSGPRPPIAFFVNSFGEGGAEKITVMQANGMIAAGHRVDVLVERDVGSYRSMLSPEVNVINFDSTSPFTILGKLCGYFRRTPPRVVISHLEKPSLLSIVAGLLTGYHKIVPVLEVNLDSYAKIDHKIRRRFLRLLLAVFYRLAPRIISVSNGCTESLAPLVGSGKAKDIVTVYNGFDLDKLRAASREPVVHPLIANKTKPCFISAGRLAPQKNFELLIRAFAEVRQKQDCMLIILGEGHMRPQLEKLVEALGVGKDVHMPGFQPNPLAWFSKCDAYVMSSKSEGLASVLMEAMAAGTRMVSTDCPSGPEEILQGGKYGALVPLDDVPALAQAMLDVLNKPPVAEQAEIQAYLDRTFSFAKMMEGYLAVVRDVETGAPSSSASS